MMSQKTEDKEKLIREVEFLRREVVELKKAHADAKQVEQALRESEERLKSITDSAPNAIVMMDNRGKVAYWNPAAERMFGYSRKEIIGRDMHKILSPPSYREEILRGFKEFKKTGKGPVVGHTLEVEALRQSGEEFPVEISVSRIKMKGLLWAVAIIRDISRKKRREERIQHLQSVLIAIRNINQLIVREKDQEGLLKRACEILSQTRDYRFVWIGLLERGTKDIVPAAQAGFEEGYLESTKITWDSSETGRGPTGTAIRTRKPSVMRDIEGDSQVGPWREEAMKRGYASSVAVPLVYEDKVWGALNVYATLPDSFDEEERDLLFDVSQDIAFALRNIELREERRRAEEALRESESQFRGIAEKSLVGVYLIHDGNFIYVNPCLAEIFGCSVDELVRGKRPEDLVHPEDWPRVEENLRKRLAGEVEAIHYEFRGRRKDGTIFPVEVFGSRTQYRGRPAVVGTLLDITERKQREEERQRHKEELERLSARLVEAHEKERKRIAQELHDEMGQALTAMRINLAAIERNLPSDSSAEIVDRLAEIDLLANQMLEKIGELSLELRPAMLDDLGLVPTLRWYTNWFAKRLKIVVEFEAINLEGRLPEQIEIAVYRIMQESLTNIARHAGADKIRVALERRGSAIVGSIADDGKGFDLRGIIERGLPEQRLGLIGMEERAAYLGGHVDICSAPGEGTRVTLEIPYEEVE